MQPKYYGAAATYNAQQKGPSTPMGRILMLVGLAVGVIIILAILLTAVSSLTKGPSDDFARLTARESNLKDLLKKQQNNIQRDDLKTVNATAQAIIASDAASLSTQLKDAFGVDGVPDAIAQAETDSTTDNTLKSAQLAATFDHVYVGVIRDKISAAYNLANDLYKRTNGKPQQVVKQVMQNLTALDTQFANLNL